MSSVLDKQKELCNESCPWCSKDLIHPRPVTPTKYTTICICADGKVYDLGKGEYPPQPPDHKLKERKYILVNAYTCPVEEANRLKAKGKKK